jgi:uncharacterized protein (DUF1684 family)
MLRRTRWVIAGLVLLATACSAPAPPGDGSYAEEVARARADKDEQFRNSTDSPIPPERRSAMLPLPYFPIDEDARVPAVLQRSENGPVVEMPTSTGKRREMRRVGVLQFTFKGQSHTLSAFSEAGAPVNRLFVPFTDLTTGTESYAAGRYLDLDPTPTGIYNIDFNRAYHPFCYFDARFDCPYPPSENRLKVAVRAGERLPTTR